MTTELLDDATFAGLVQSLREGAEAVEAQVRRVPPARWDETAPGFESGWTRRQLLAHIAANDQRQITRVRVGAGLGTPADERDLEAQADVHTWNQQQVEARSGRGVDELVTEMHARRRELIDLLQRLTPSQRSRLMPFRDTHLPLVEMVPTLLGHLTYHAGELNA